MAGRNKLVVHDYSGHPFQVQLSRELARRGWQVTHLHCPSFTTGKGNLERGADDPETFDIQGVQLRRRFDKYSGARRLLQEIEYGWRCARRIKSLNADTVISSNTPLVAAVILHALLFLRRTPVVFWQQDIYSVAMEVHLRRKLGPVGAAVGWMLRRAERWIASASHSVVVISEDFVSTLNAWDIPDDKVAVINNWAPIEELPVGGTGGDWAERHGLAGKRIVLYAGTLGLKHDPSLLLEVARQLSMRDDAVLVVASEGRGANWLAERAEGVSALRLVGFQPYEDLPDMLAASDVLLVLLESEAGVFSVPSKVLTYLCAGRPIVGSMPHQNLAARTIEREDAGIVVDNAEASSSFVAAVEKLLADDDLRGEMGARARAYAERAFDIRAIGDRFEDLVHAAIPSGASLPEAVRTGR